MMMAIVTETSTKISFASFALAVIFITNLVSIFQLSDFFSLTSLEA